MAVSMAQMKRLIEIKAADNEGKMGTLKNLVVFINEGEEISDVDKEAADSAGLALV